MREFIIAFAGEGPSTVVHAERPEDALAEAVKQDAKFMPFAGIPPVPNPGYPGCENNPFFTDRDQWIVVFKSKVVTFSSEKI